jgi:hypothetical protein
MKFASLLLVASSFLAVSAFGVNPRPSVVTTQQKSKPPVVIKTTFQDAAVGSHLFVRDPVKTRGGAVPGWAEYNKALDDKPLITKALTSLVGWALGDLLAQVREPTGGEWLSVSVGCWMKYLMQ